VRPPRHPFPAPPPQGLPSSLETRSFAAELLARVPRKQSDKARAPRACAGARNAR
jgi:hypothetical protein